MTPAILHALLSSTVVADRVRGLEHVRRVALACDGAHAPMARQLGIAPSTLHDWRRRFSGVQLAVTEARIAGDYRRTGGPRKSTRG